MKNRPLIVIIALALVSLIGFQLASFLANGPGFPLDDAWIHQGYARNLASNGEWAFISGQPSAGATSLLWVILLAPSFLFSISPTIWVSLLGFLTLLAIALVSRKIWLLHYPAQASAAIILSGVILFEWHLLWAAVSGMETLLFALIATLCCARLIEGERNGSESTFYWFQIGLLLAIAITTRPDGITLLGPVLLTLLIVNEGAAQRAKALLQMLVPMIVVLAPNLILNLSISGRIWPNTFYAKQAEYSILLEQGFLERLFQLLKVPLVGVGVLLLPGFIYLLFDAWKSQRRTILFSGLWIGGYIALYAWRLPLGFQHGRYIIPVMPLFFILSGLGLGKIIEINAKPLMHRVVSRVWLLAIAIVSIFFWNAGSSAFKQDVGFIQSEMVATAQWINKNIPREKLIAAHDIGAIGYFSERPIVDLAGLVSPEIIPFIRDEEQLREFLDRQSVDYLITFPSWYPNLTAQANIVYQSVGEKNRKNGHESMAIFDWKR